MSLKVCAFTIGPTYTYTVGCHEILWCVGVKKKEREKERNANRCIHWGLKGHSKYIQI